MSTPQPLTPKSAGSALPTTPMTARQRLMEKLGVDAGQRLSPQRLMSLAEKRLQQTENKDELQALLDDYRKQSESRKKRKAPAEAEEPKDGDGGDLLGRLLAEYEKEKRARRELEKLSDEKLTAIFAEIAKILARA